MHTSVCRVKWWQRAMLGCQFQVVMSRQRSRFEHGILCAFSNIGGSSRMLQIQEIIIKPRPRTVFEKVRKKGIATGFVKDWGTNSTHALVGRGTVMLGDNLGWILWHLVGSRWGYHDGQMGVDSVCSLVLSKKSLLQDVGTQTVKELIWGHSELRQDPWSLARHRELT
jgi:hypothetical protein